MSLSFEMPPGYRLEKFDNLDSTNEEAKRRAQTGAAPGLIISAQSQSAGRGRQGRTWISPSGGLYFSILLRPTCPAAKAAQLSFVSALAVGEGIATSLRDPERLCFKWPNDVLIGTRKVAGILLESGSGSKTLEWLVVGIGINIESHPENMNYPATCLIHETGTACDPAQVLGNVVHAFDKWCRIWEGEGYAAESIEGAMILAIDSGNTNVVFAVQNGNDVQSQWRAATVAERTADEYMVWLTQLMNLDGVDPNDIDGAIIASVVPQAVFNQRSLCRRYFNTTPLVVGDPNVDLGISVKVDRPNEVGADRLVNAVAAHATYGEAVIVIDFGTATTFDVVDDDGSYLGGVISPGVNLSLEALHTAAAQLPRVAIARPARVIGKATVPAMTSGIYWGYVGLIEGLVARIQEEFGKPMMVIATGGLSTVFSNGTNVIDKIDPDLTIRGLFEIYRRNRP
jgi:type III pantothenate kinase